MTKLRHMAYDLMTMSHQSEDDVHIETLWLKTFITAARTENFRMAALELFIDQATVSHHMARLEEAVGTPLFQRQGRGVRLTPEGRSYVSYAERMLFMEQDAKRAIAWATQAPRIHLAASPALAETILPWLCRELYRRHSPLDIRVSVHASRDLPQALSNSVPDALFSRAALPAGTWESHLLFHDPVDLVAPAAADPWEFQDLMRSRVIIQPSSVYTVALLNQLRDIGIRPAVLAVDQISVTKRLVEESVGVAFLPRSSTVREVLEGRLVTADWPQRYPLVDPVYWSLPKDRPPSRILASAERILHARFPNFPSARP